MNGRITLAHGDGGEQAHRLIQDVFIAAFGDSSAPMMDAAIQPVSGAKLAVTTDSFVVQPIFFPGGNIGKLAVAGTVNDLIVSGAEPLYLTCGFILEEGFSLKELQVIVKSMAEEAAKSNVRIVAGDTKVVERGACDGIFINTTGIGVIREERQLHPTAITEGDSVIVTGTIGDHGVSIIAARNELGLRTDVLSDCASLTAMLSDALISTSTIRIMRDPTRGGLATSLVEIAEDFGVTVELDEEEIPVRPDVQGACELLGFEPIYLANEGKAVIIVSQSEEMQLLETLRRHPEGANAAVIGRVTNTTKGQLLLRTVFGSSRRLHRLSGVLLPRIC
ncbi:hydrogenase expression/formation protein HypE [Paenibacillus albiflavus]|uniref:Hydrogenase expression/formation protein HypE n=1 Tax=Paenibacillus albiflavus TaxID=2545760 RepID=A0A4R4EJ31_9BACL|nr:hydrogenase expression/formation protein HypE [Paenibacillus albiflavus]TCZ78235.1 hydrogenase expression/formation protein HypE [Paenibacillus albiflavus]